ncbi:MAG: exo-alpha-sialidase [Clostridia bacterium]|nr:exo-alpha-sialidase [Clostridia bacterium]
MLITDKKELRRFYADRRVWQGIPGIACTPGGREFVSFYSGNTKETYGNFAILMMREKDGSFGEPIAVAEKAGRYRCFDPVLWMDPLGRLWFIWNVMPGEQVMAAICEHPDDDPLVFGEEFCIGRGIMMNKPIVLSSGEWLFPIAVWKTDIYYEFRKSALKENEVAGSYVYKTIDNGESFCQMGYADMRDRTFDEHMLLEMDNGALEMLVRTKYGIGVAYSYDRGKTWSRGENSGLGGPNSRFHVCRLRSGRVLLINHVNNTARDHLTALLSEDGGRTFPHSLLLDARNEVSYPDAMEDEEGYIHITYDRERGCFKRSLDEAYACNREILTAKVTEADILAGRLVDKGSYLKKVVNKLGVLAPDCPDPYLKKPVAEMAKELLQQDKEAVLRAIFDLYPVNCTDTTDFDAEKLDRLLAAFEDADGKEESLLTEILTLLEKAPPGEEPTRYLVDRVQKYIEEDLKHDASLSTVAEHMKVSKYYLAHLFKEVTGITITEFRNERRLTAAKSLLIHSQKSMEEIAEEVGFSTAAYFAEIFTRAERIPPSKYRKYHQ